MQDRPNERIEQMLQAYEAYRGSLMDLFDALDIMQCYAGPPEMLISRLLVAELLGGVALPERDHVLTGVFGPDGERVAVVVVSDHAGWQSGRIMPPDPSSLPSSMGWDLLAVVAFQHASPTVVHLIPANRFRDVVLALSVPSSRPASFGNLVCLDELFHCNLVLEPAVAAALGVRTVLLNCSLENRKQ